MLIGGHQRLFDGQPHHLLRAQPLAACAAPLAQDRARLVQVAVFERPVYIGEIVAHMTETHGHIQDEHIEAQGQQRRQVIQEVIPGNRQQRSRDHAQRPGDRALGPLAGIEVLLQQIGKSHRRGDQVLAIGEGPPLLEQQGDDQRD